ncbi:MAG: carbohydrate kinase family protein [Clostridia bacterium]|nr:carbohydrate kinase family protein [Clostridia bacterium]
MRTVGAVSRLTVDLLFTGLSRWPEPGEELRAPGHRMAAGGGMPVTPLLLSRLGVPSRLGTFLDGSLLSRVALDLIAPYGDCEIVDLHRGGAAPVTLSVVAPMGGDRAILSYEEELPRPDEEALLSFFRPCDIALFHPDRPLAERLRAMGKRVLYDPDEFTSRLMTEEVLSACDIVTPDLREAERITGERDPERALRRLRAMGAALPVIKLGAEGCLFLEGDRPVRLPPPRLGPAADTTGAGDCFMAGLAYGLARDLPFRACAGMGNVFGALCTLAPGALGADHSRERVERVYRETYGEDMGGEA